MKLLSILLGFQITYQSTIVNTSRKIDNSEIYPFRFWFLNWNLVEYIIQTHSWHQNNETMNSKGCKMSFKAWQGKDQNIFKVRKTIFLKKGFKWLSVSGLYAALKIRELVNSWFRFLDVMNRLLHNLFATLEPPKYSNSPNLCFDSI